MEDGVDGLRGGDEEDSGGCCWRPVCADEGSSVASVLMRETVACGRLKREDLPRKGGSGIDGSRGRRKIVGRVGGAGLGSLKMGEDERKGSADEGRSWRQLLAFGFKGRRRWWNRLRKKKIKREGFGAVFG